MPTRNNAATHSRLRTALGKRIAGAAREVAAHLRGEIALPAYEVTVPDMIDVASPRARLSLPQAAFARTSGLDPKHGPLREAEQEDRRWRQQEPPRQARPRPPPAAEPCRASAKPAAQSRGLAQVLSSHWPDPLLPAG